MDAAASAEGKGKWAGHLQKAKDLGMQGGAKAKNAAQKANAGFEKFEKIEQFDGFEKLSSAPADRPTFAGRLGTINEALNAKKQQVSAGFEKMTSPQTEATEQSTVSKGLGAISDRINANKQAVTAGFEKIAASAPKEEGGAEREGNFSRFSKTLVAGRDKVSAHKDNIAGMVPTVNLSAAGERGLQKMQGLRVNVVPDSGADEFPSPLTSSHSPSPNSESIMERAKTQSTQGIGRLKDGIVRLKDSIPIPTLGIRPPTPSDAEDPEDFTRQHSTSLAPAPQRSPSPQHGTLPSPSARMDRQDTEDDYNTDEALASTVQHTPDTADKARRHTIPVALDTVLFEEKVSEEEEQQKTMDSDDELQVSGLTPLHRTRSPLRTHSGLASPRDVNIFLSKLTLWDDIELSSIRGATRELRKMREELVLRNERTTSRLQSEHRVDE